MKTRILLIGLIIFFVNVISVNAQVIKNGSCPGGWNSSGKYCVPGNNAKAIVPKNGSCPGGWNSSGNYCVAGSSAKAIVPKNGSCPGGWNSSG
ncbi:uncharacterized protein METZ01_LOCUS461732, partial [marine metagenome]